MTQTEDIFNQCEERIPYKTQYNSCQRTLTNQYQSQNASLMYTRALDKDIVLMKEGRQVQ